MNLTEQEQKLLLRALDRASAPAEAEKAAEALIASLRKRGVNGYDFLNGTTPMPEPAVKPDCPSKAWQKKRKADWYRDYVNPWKERKYQNPPRGVDPDYWRAYCENREPSPEEQARMDYREAFNEWLHSDGNTPPPQKPGDKQPRPWWNGGIYDKINEWEKKQAAN